MTLNNLDKKFVRFKFDSKLGIQEIPESNIKTSMKFSSKLKDADLTKISFCQGYSRSF